MTGEVEEMERQASNLRAAASAVLTPEDRDFFADKIAATCQFTANWLEEQATAMLAQRAKDGAQ